MSPEWENRHGCEYLPTCRVNQRETIMNCDIFINWPGEPGEKFENRPPCSEALDFGGGHLGQYTDGKRMGKEGRLDYHNPQPGATSTSFIGKGMTRQP